MSGPSSSTCAAIERGWQKPCSAKGEWLRAGRTSASSRAHALTAPQRAEIRATHKHCSAGGQPTANTAHHANQQHPASATQLQSTFHPAAATHYPLPPTTDDNHTCKQECSVTPRSTHVQPAIKQARPDQPAMQPQSTCQHASSHAISLQAVSLLCP